MVTTALSIGAPTATVPEIDDGVTGGAGVGAAPPPPPQALTSAAQAQATAIRLHRFDMAGNPLTEVEATLMRVACFSVYRCSLFKSKYGTGRYVAALA